MEEKNSGANTVLITLVLVILVGFIVWWVTIRGTGISSPNEDSSGLDVDINFPGGQNNPPPAAE